MQYADFIAAKSQHNTGDGFAPTFVPPVLFDFQASLIDWSVRKGRAAIFADCGLGKTLLELVWAENIVRHTYRGWSGKQTENRYSHWIWRQYASAFWDDVRIDRVLPFRDAREPDDEKHVHPLQLDVIERCCVLWSNPSERVLTPFMGVGSEVYVPVTMDRYGVGIELKPSYFRQARLNCAEAVKERAERARGGKREKQMSFLEAAE